jgi:hypothetical protein
MAKETTIKISFDFKEYLRRQKLENEDFETAIKRLIQPSIPANLCSIPPSIPISIEEKTSTGNDEEFNEEQKFSLFDEPTIKICKEHNLPAEYNSFEEKWMCKKCHYLSEHLVKENNFTNISDFNLAVLKNELETKKKPLFLINEIKDQKEIKIIQIDPVQIINHQQEYGRFPL